jgi:hypothetical protein
MEKRAGIWVASGVPDGTGRGWMPGRLAVGGSMFPGRDGMLPQVLDAACGLVDWGLGSRPSLVAHRWETEGVELRMVHRMSHIWVWTPGVALRLPGRVWLTPKRWGVIPFLVLWRPIGASGRLEDDDEMINWARGVLWLRHLVSGGDLGPEVGGRCGL